MIRRIIYFTLLLVAMTTLPSCHSTEWDDMPSEISEFLSKYFPEQEVSDFGSTDDGYHVRLKNSVAVTFNNNCVWLSVNGYGQTLPQMFLFDELPPVLYEHLQELGELNNVYAVSRDTKSYFVRLLDSDLNYNISNDEITRIQ